MSPKWRQAFTQADYVGQDQLNKFYLDRISQAPLSSYQANADYAWYSTVTISSRRYLFFRHGRYKASGWLKEKGPTRNILLVSLPRTQYE